ncbi:MAG TPA: CvpA family protein [Chloroflexaceae bacterium]|nr:CvpA family protein [Chloroflexaceae bacterium]
MWLTLLVALAVGAGALLGALRGVRPGLVAVGGTLLAAVLVDLWAEPLAGWLRATFRPELPGAPTFALIALVFLLAAGLLGYGGGAMLPPGPADPGLYERVVGALLGALNGALVAAYLLRYALERWDGRRAEPVVAASPLAGLLVDWLPWTVLGMVAATGAIVLARLGRAAVARSAARRASGAGSVAAAPNLAEADKRLSGKIDEALKK